MIGSDNYIILTILDGKPCSIGLLKKLVKNFSKRLYDLKQMGCQFSYSDDGSWIFLDDKPECVIIDHKTRRVHGKYERVYRSKLKQLKELQACMEQWDAIWEDYMGTVDSRIYHAMKKFGSFIFNFIKTKLGKSSTSK